MLVGGTWSGLSRALAHTKAYARAYFGIGLISVVVPPACVAHILSLIVVVPATFVTNLVLVRLFPRRSWTREPWRGWLAGVAGLMLVWVGTITWLLGAGPKLFGVIKGHPEWLIALYVLTIPVLLSNLGVLLGYLPDSEQEDRIKL